MDMNKYLVIEATVLKIKELATPGTWSIVERTSEIMMKYVDRLGRKIEIQLCKDDNHHFVRIDGVRDYVAQSSLLSVLR